MNEEKNEEMTPEVYREILAAIKAKDAKILALEQSVNELKEAKQKSDKEKTEADSTIIGTCSKCNHALTAAEARNNTVCPYCHAGTSVHPA